MRERIITIIIFIIILISSLYFGLPRLQTFSGVDEPYWSYGRVPKFWQSVKEGNWKATHLCDKPGIGTVLVSGAGLPFIHNNPKDLQKLRYEPKRPGELSDIWSLYFKLRLPIFIFTLLSLPYFYYLIRKLLGQNTARLAIIFIGLSPILLGISLIINTDAVLWILTAISTLNLFIFFKTGEKKHLYLAGFFLGLSVISKYVANVLFVYFFLLFLLEYILANQGKMSVAEYLKKSLIDYFLLFATAMVTAFVFFPATWVKIKILFKYTVAHPVFSSTLPIIIGLLGLLALDYFILKSKISAIIFGFLEKYKNIILKIAIGVFLALILLVILNVYFGVKFYDIQSLITSPKGIGQDLDAGDASVEKIINASKGTGLLNIFNLYVGAILADLYSLLFSISPFVLFFILFSAIALLLDKRIGRDSIIAFYIIVFILAYYFGSALNNVTTTVRYQIMTYPLVFVLAAIGANKFLEYEKIKKFFAAPAAYLVFILVLIGSLIGIRPHFLAYASEILPKDMIVNFKGMGEGSFEAGQYLNSLPEAHDLTIWSDKGAVCEAFVGKCYIDFKYEKIEDVHFDYFVVSTDRRSRSLKRTAGTKMGSLIDFEKAYPSDDFDYQIIIGGRPVNFVKVIKAGDIYGTNP